MHNRKVPVSEMCDKIDEVTAESLQKVANRIFSPESGNKPTVVTMGHEDVKDPGRVFKTYDVGSV